MALTRNDKKVMAVAVAMAAVIVGALVWWRVLEGQEQAALSAAQSQSAQFGTPPRPSNPADTPSLDAVPPDAAESSQGPNAAGQQTQESQTAPPRQESAQAAQDAPPPQAEPSPQALSPAQAEPSEAARRIEPDDAAGAATQPEQAQDQTSAAPRAEKKAREKSGPTRHSSRQEKRDAYRVVDGVAVTETATELVFILQGTAGAVRPNVMVLSSPPRLVADLPSDWVYRGSAQPKNPNPLVLGIRSGRTDQRLRIVADLAAMPDGGRPIVGTSPEGVVIRVNKPVKK